MDLWRKRLGDVISSFERASRQEAPPGDEPQPMIASSSGQDNGEGGKRLQMGVRGPSEKERMRLACSGLHGATFRDVSVPARQQGSPLSRQSDLDTYLHGTMQCQGGCCLTPAGSHKLHSLALRSCISLAAIG